MPLFSGRLGALVIISGELGSKHIFWGFRELCQKKVKKKAYKLHLFDFFKLPCIPDPLYIFTICGCSCGTSLYFFPSSSNCNLKFIYSMDN